MTHLKLMSRSTVNVPAAACWSDICFSRDYASCRNVDQCWVDWRSANCPSVDTCWTDWS